MKRVWIMVHYAGADDMGFEILPQNRLIDDSWDVLEKGVWVSLMCGNFKCRAKVVHVNDDIKYIRKNFEYLREKFLDCQRNQEVEKLQTCQKQELEVKDDKEIDQQGLPFTCVNCGFDNNPTNAVAGTSDPPTSTTVENTIRPEMQKMKRKLLARYYREIVEKKDKKVNYGEIKERTSEEVNSKEMEKRNNKEVNSKEMEKRNNKEVNYKEVEERNNKEVNNKEMEKRNNKEVNYKEVEKRNNKEVNYKEIEKRNNKKVNYKEIAEDRNKEVNNKETEERKSKEDKIVYIGPGKTIVPRTVFQAINWNNYSGAARKLLMATFDRETLATHSLTGKPSPAFLNTKKPTKMMLDPVKIEDIVDTVASKCAVPKKFVRSAITTKCADENKMYRKRLLKENRTPVKPKTHKQEGI